MPESPETNFGIDANMLVDFYKSDPGDKIMIAFKIHKLMECAEQYQKAKEDNHEEEKEQETTFH